MEKRAQLLIKTLIIVIEDFLNERRWLRRKAFPKQWKVGSENFVQDQVGADSPPSSAGQEPGEPNSLTSKDHTPKSTRRVTSVT